MHIMIFVRHSIYTNEKNRGRKQDSSIQYISKNQIYSRKHFWIFYKQLKIERNLEIFCICVCIPICTIFICKEFKFPKEYVYMCINTAIYTVFSYICTCIPYFLFIYNFVHIEKAYDLSTPMIPKIWSLSIPVFVQTYQSKVGEAGPLTDP